MFSQPDDCFHLKDCEKYSFFCLFSSRNQMTSHPLFASGRFPTAARRGTSATTTLKCTATWWSSIRGAWTMLCSRWRLGEAFLHAYSPQKPDFLHACLENLSFRVWKISLDCHSMVKSIARPHNTVAQESDSVVLFTRLFYWYLYKSFLVCCVYKNLKKKRKRSIYCIPVYIINVCVGPQDLASSRCFMLMGFYAYRRKAHRSLWTKFFSEHLYCHLEIPLFSLLLCIKDYVNQEAVRLIPPQCITS